MRSLLVASEESKGSVLDRFRTGVHRVESSLQGLVGSFGEFVVRQIIASRLGYNPPRERVSPELKNEIRQHIRIVGLRAFEPVRSAGVNDVSGAEQLLKRADIAWGKSTGCESTSNKTKQRMQSNSLRIYCSCGLAR